MHQIRSKWQYPARNLEIGDVVYVAEENQKPLQWPLAKVTNTFKGNDGLVRVVEVVMNGRKFTRPVRKLRKLPLPNSQHN